MARIAALLISNTEVVSTTTLSTGNLINVQA